MRKLLFVVAIVLCLGGLTGCKKTEQTATASTRGAVCKNCRAY